MLGRYILRVSIMSVLIALMMTVVGIACKKNIVQGQAQQLHINATAVPTHTHTLRLVPAESGGHRLFLLSAFFDARPLSLLSTPRVLMLASLDEDYVSRIKNETIPDVLRCVLEGGETGRTWVTLAKVVELAEGNKRKYRPSFIQCLLNNTVTTSMVGRDARNLPTHVAVQMVDAGVVTATSPAVEVAKMPLAPFPPHAPQAQRCRNEAGRMCEPLGICVAPMLGDIYGNTIHHFFDHYSDLAGGNVLFMLYNLSAGGATSSTIQDYARRGHAIEVVQWELESGGWAETRGVRSQTFYNGQMLAINDCMLRMVGRARWVGYVDLDEYIVPRCGGAVTFGDIIAATLTDNVFHTPAAFMFLNSLYDASCQTALGQQGEGERPPQMALHRLADEFQAGNRSKIFSNPLAVDEQGIHWVRRFLISQEHEMNEDLVVATMMQSFWDQRLNHGLAYAEHIAAIRSGIQASTVVVPPSISASHHVRYVPEKTRRTKDCSNIFVFGATHRLDDRAVRARSSCSLPSRLLFYQLRPLNRHPKTNILAVVGEKQGGGLAREANSL